MSRVLMVLGLVGCSMDNSLSPFSDSNRGDGPAIVVDPMTLQFDALGAGEQQVATFAIHSVGGSALAVESLTLAGPGAASFTLLSDPTPLILEVGDSVSVEVAFEAMGDGDQSGLVEVRSSDALEPLVPVTLLGAGAVSQLQITPDPMDFGDIAVGCDREQAVTLANVGSDDLTVLGIEGPGGAFTVLSVPELPLTLAPGEEAAVDIGFVPDAEGSVTGTLTVTSTEPQGVRTAEQTGAGTLEGWQEDHWDHPIEPPTDIVFSVDQSGSMDDDIERLGENFSTFIGQLSDHSTDWQVMVANDDDGCSNSGTLTPDTTSYASRFSQAVSSFDQECLLWGWVGTGIPCYTEALLTTATAAVQATDPGECNAGFLRNDAMLHVIVVSDEPDQSDLSWSAYVDDLIAQKGNASMVRISAIAGDYPSGCASAEAGDGYHQAVAATDGVFLSICSDWASDDNLALLAEASVQQDHYPLSDDAVEETIAVSVDGESVESGWHYDAQSGAVVFDSDAPQSGSSVTIGYTPAGDCD